MSTNNSRQTTPQSIPDPQPDTTPLRELTRSLKRDPKGIGALGYDGVFRSFDEERNVVDAVGLSPAQIREYYADVPVTIPPKMLAADGRKVSRRDMFHPDAESIPKKFTEEDRAKMLA